MIPHLSIKAGLTAAQTRLADPTQRFFALVILADLAFFAVHLAYSPDGLLDEPRFRLDWDRGYAETYQYLKEFWSVLLLGTMTLRHRTFVYAVFTVLFTYLALDDLWRLHERVGGGVLGARLPDLRLLGGTLGGYDVGQVVYAAGIGLSALLVIALLSRRADKSVKKTAHVLLLLLAALAAFGVVGDVVTALTKADAFNRYVALVEEGGEHLAMSAVLGYLFVVSARPVLERAAAHGTR